MARRTRTKSVLIGLVAIAVFCGAVVFAGTAQNGLPGSTETVVRAAFTDVGSLRVSDDVRIASVRVGRVSAISYEKDRAVVDLALTDVDTVYRNASALAASVGARSALGLKFVDLKPGTPDAGVMREGEIIPARKTSGAQDLTDLLTALDEPTRDALGSTIREMGGGFAGHGGDLDDALRNLPRELPDLATIARALSADNGADTVRVLQALDRFAGRFTGRQRELSDLVGQLDATLGAVAVDGGEPLDAALAESPSTVAEARQALRALKRPVRDLRATMATLRPGAQALGKAAPDVRGVLREAVPPLGKVPGVARQAKPAVSALTGVFADARPVTPRLARTLRLAADPLRTLEPYAPEIAAFFTYGRRALSDGDDAGHWARFFVMPGPEYAVGTAPGQRDPLLAREPYPAPGEAAGHRKTDLFGGN